MFVQSEQKHKQSKYHPVIAVTVKLVKENSRLPKTSPNKA